LKGFQDGQYRVLVATDVAARGIHVEGIAHVVNYDLPQAPGDFIHRVGRTGRAGTRGTASTFGMRSERSDIREIERTLKVRLNRRDVSLDVVTEDQLQFIVPIAAHRPGPVAKRPERRSGPREFGAGGSMRAFGESRKRRPNAGAVKFRGRSGNARLQAK
jgi:ATP-dependent RNA helicase RhlE